MMAVQSWMAVETTYPNGSTFSRGESLFYTAASLAAVALFVPLLYVLMYPIVAGLAHQSTGELAGHGVMLVIHGLL